MRYQEYLPDSSLQPYVKCFWILERQYTAENPIERVTPDGWIELILNYGDPYILQEEATPDREMPKAFLVGLQRQPLAFRCEGTVKLVAARLQPWSLLPLFGLEPPVRANPMTSLGSEWREMAASLEQVFADDSYEGAVSALQDYLLERLPAISPNDERIRKIVKLAKASKGGADVSELADYGHLSVRKLQRQFNRAVGLSAKQLSRSIRFERVSPNADAGSGISWGAGVWPLGHGRAT